MHITRKLFITFTMAIDFLSSACSSSSRNIDLSKMISAKISAGVFIIISLFIVNCFAGAGDKCRTASKNCNDYCITSKYSTGGDCAHDIETNLNACFCGDVKSDDATTNNNCNLSNDNCQTVCNGEGFTSGECSSNANPNIPANCVCNAS